MCLTGGFLEVRRLFHLSGAPHRIGYDRKVKKTDCSRKLKSLDGDFRRFPEGQEDPGLSGVRQKDRRTLSWVESGQVDTGHK